MATVGTPAWSGAKNLLLAKIHLPNYSRLEIISTLQPEFRKLPVNIVNMVEFRTFGTWTVLQTESTATEGEADGPHGVRIRKFKRNGKFN